MSKRFLLGSMLLSEPAAIELSQVEYEGIVLAVDRLLSCLDAEEKFDCIVENYRDLEKHILDQAFGSLFGVDPSHVSFHVTRNTTSRKLSNFISSVRLYQDTIGRHARMINDEEAAFEEIKAEKSNQFDSSLSYRTLDALRNHAQHHALPVHGTVVARRLTDDREFSEHEFEAIISVAELAANPDFRPKKTLDELKGGPEKLKLKSMVRDYVESLSTIHQRFRELTGEAVGRHFRAIGDAKAKLFAEFPHVRDIALAVYPADCDGLKIEDETQISGKMEEYLRFLRDKNKHLVKFARRRLIY